MSSIKQSEEAKEAFLSLFEEAEKHDKSNKTKEENGDHNLEKEKINTNKIKKDFVDWIERQFKSPKVWGSEIHIERVYDNTDNTKVFDESLKIHLSKLKK